MMNATFRHITLRMAGLLRPASVLLLSALTALAVVSCGGSDDASTPEPPVPPQPKVDAPIAFSGSLSEGESESHARTRAATTPLSDTHKTFKVWGYKNTNESAAENVMQNYTVNYTSGSAGTTTSNSSGWEYVNQQPGGGTEQSIKYWDFTANDYRFFGYAGSGVTPSYSSSGDANHPSVSLSFAVDATTANLTTLSASTPLYSKLWHKNGSAIASDISPVTLEFLQPYVKVRFLFRQSESAETIFILTEQSFRPTDTNKKIYTKGTFTTTYPLAGTSTEEMWNVTPGTEDTDYLTALTQDYYEAASDETDPNILAHQKKWYVVLPTVSQGTYTLTVKVNNDPRTVVVPEQYMDWLPGYEYTYVFKITDPGGVELESVQAGFNPWTVHTGVKNIFNW